MQVLQISLRVYWIAKLFLRHDWLRKMHTLIISSCFYNLSETSDIFIKKKRNRADGEFARVR